MRTMTVRATILVLQGRQKPREPQAHSPSNGGNRMNHLLILATGGLSWLYVCSLDHISEVVCMQPKCRGHPCECACGTPCHVPLWVPVCIHWSVCMYVQPVTARMAWEHVVALWTLALGLSSAAIPLVNLKSLIVNGCLL